MLVLFLLPRQIMDYSADARLKCLFVSRRPRGQREFGMELSAPAARVQKRFRSLTQLWPDALLRVLVAGGRARRSTSLQKITRGRSTGTEGRG
jgi:hypothetical protein